VSRLPLLQVDGLSGDVANLEALNAALKSQVVVVETEARRMQLRFAQASAKLGVPLSPAQQGKLQRDVDATSRRHNSVAASLNLPPKGAAPTPAAAPAGAAVVTAAATSPPDAGIGGGGGGGKQDTSKKRPDESWSDYYQRSAN